MQEVYGIAAFRSRQQVLMLESALRRQGLSVGVVYAPGRGLGLRAVGAVSDAGPGKGSPGGGGTAAHQSGGHLSGERVCLRARQTYASGQLFGKLIFVFRRRGGGRAIDRAAV